MSWRKRLLWLTGGLCVLFGTVVGFVPRRGSIVNDSQHVLWVVETDGGRAVAHRLAPGRRSPPGLDADGVRSVENLAIGGHTSWWKVRDVSVGTVRDEASALVISCLACSAVEDDEFGTVRFDPAPDWGVVSR